MYDAYKESHTQTNLRAKLDMVLNVFLINENKNGRMTMVFQPCSLHQHLTFKQV